MEFSFVATAILYFPCKLFIISINFALFRHFFSKFQKIFSIFLFCNILSFSFVGNPSKNDRPLKFFSNLILVQHLELENDFKTPSK